MLPYLELTILTVGGAATPPHPPPRPTSTHLSLSVLTDSSVKERKSMQWVWALSNEPAKLDAVASATEAVEGHVKPAAGRGCPQP